MECCTCRGERMVPIELRRLDYSLDLVHELSFVWVVKIDGSNFSAENEGDTSE